MVPYDCPAEVVLAAAVRARFCFEAIQVEVWHVQVFPIANPMSHFHGKKAGCVDPVVYTWVPRYVLDYEACLRVRDPSQIVLDVVRGVVNVEEDVQLPPSDSHHICPMTDGHKTGCLFGLWDYQHVEAVCSGCGRRWGERALVPCVRGDGASLDAAAADRMWNLGVEARYVVAACQPRCCRLAASSRWTVSLLMETLMTQKMVSLEGPSQRPSES